MFKSTQQKIKDVETERQNKGSSDTVRIESWVDDSKGRKDPKKVLEKN